MEFDDPQSAGKPLAGAALREDVRSIGIGIAADTIELLKLTVGGQLTGCLCDRTGVYWNVRAS